MILAAGGMAISMGAIGIAISPSFPLVTPSQLEKGEARYREEARLPYQVN